MKIGRITLQESGTALLASLLIAGIFATILGLYLSMTTQENLVVKRSTGWNTAMPLAEAGIEEACSQVTVNTNNFLADGWTQNTNTLAYHKTRTLGDGYYSVDINGTIGVATITSTGYGHWAGGSNYISRTVEITAELPTPYFPSGLIANTIDFHGNFNADSFDSRTNAYSTNGRYDKKKATDHALIASPNSAGYALGGSADIDGYVASDGPVTWSGSTSVGDFSFTKNSKGIEAGHLTNNFTLTLTPVPAPPTNSVNTPNSGTNAGIAYDYILNKSGVYVATNLLATKYGGTMFVAKDAWLFVTGDVSITQITFTNGAKLRLVLGYPNISFCPTLVNGSAPQFWVLGLPSCANMKITGGNFVGVIYAPNMYLDAEGNASIEGGVVAGTFHCQGGFDFHQDDAAGGQDPTPFRILSWAEK